MRRVIAGTCFYVDRGDPSLMSQFGSFGVRLTSAEIDWEDAAAQKGRVFRQGGLSYNVSRAFYALRNSDVRRRGNTEEQDAKSESPTSIPD